MGGNLYEKVTGKQVVVIFAVCVLGVAGFMGVSSAIAANANKPVVIASYTPMAPDGAELAQMKADAEAAIAEAAAVEAARVAAEAQAAADAAVTAQAAADAAAAQAAADAQAANEAEPDAPAAEPADDGVPAGYWPLPWVASSDPNNANGGDWDMSQCFTSGSTFNGQAYCAP